MSIWTRITDALQALTAGEGLAAVFDRLRSPPERSVGFAIAVIALGAKMAKADGVVTRDEVMAFREVFAIAPEDEKNAGRVFNLARQDVAGFEEYARSVARMFEPGDPAVTHLMEGLFHVAVADGDYHEAEDAYLARVAEILGLARRDFMAIRARFVPNAEQDPWSVLGIDPGASRDEARAAWRRLVKESHPDRLIAAGVPEEAIRLAETRMQVINRAWAEIEGRGGARAG